MENTTTHMNELVQDIEKNKILSSEFNCILKEEDSKNLQAFLQENGYEISECECCHLIKWKKN